MSHLQKIIKGSFVAVMLSMMLSLAILTPQLAYAADPDDPLAGLDTDAGQSPDELLEGTGAIDPSADSAAPAEESAEAVISSETSSFTDIAAALPQATEQSRNSEDIISKVAENITLVHRLFVPWINYFAFQIGNFLGNDYIFQGAMGKMLHKIWVISRNLVNIAFVFLLLWIAIKQIFSFGKETENLSKSLIKFTALLIFVNFSWLATKVVLDAASVVTHVAFAIPSGISGTASSVGIDLPQCQVNTGVSTGGQTLKGSCSPSVILSPQDAGASTPFYFADNESDTGGSHCEQVKKAYSGEADSAYAADGTRTSEETAGKNAKFQGRTSICMENLNFFKYDQNTAVIYITYGMARIQNLVGATAGDAIQLSVGAIMSLIMQAAYALTLTALFLALVIRMLMLWMFVAFSPFIILIMWFKDDMMADVGSGGYMFGWNSFAKWAFVPAMVGGVFSVSFIMISAGQATGDVFVDKVNAGGFTYKLFENQSIFMGIGSLQSFIWLLMSIAVLWVGVFTILKDYAIIGALSEKVLSGTRERAMLIAQAPLIAPIIPLGGQKKHQSILHTFHDYDIGTTKLREWDRASRDTEGDAVRLSNKAKNLTRADSQAALANTSVDTLNVLAGKLGYNNGNDLRERHTDEQILAALKQNGQIQEGDAKKIVTAFNSHFNRSAGAGAPAPHATPPTTGAVPPAAGAGPAAAPPHGTTPAAH